MVRVRSIAWLAALVVCAACGGKNPTSTSAHNRPTVVVDAGTDTGVGKGQAGVVVTAKLTSAACAKLIDHVLQIAIVLHNKKQDPEYQPTVQQIARIRTKLRAELGPACLRFSGNTYDCVMKAADRPSYAKCAAGGAETSP